jgi:hypothetical protein
MSDTKAYILQKYGPLLTREQVAEIFRMEPDSFTNAVSGERIKLRKRGLNAYHYADVAIAVDAFSSYAPDGSDLSAYIGTGSANPRDPTPPRPRPRSSRTRTAGKLPHA